MQTGVRGSASRSRTGGLASTRISARPRSAALKRKTDMENIRLKSVNWEHGMLLTPDHFLRQEHYLESLLFWSIGYLTTGYGLVGGGVRLPASDLGAIRYDPAVLLDEGPEALGVSVTKL